MPQVDLVMTDGTRYTTDDGGYIAFNRSGYLNTPDVFTVESFGYALPAGNTVTLTPVLGTIATVTVNQTQIAERLYRATGANLYAATVELGLTPPIANPLSDANVSGQDTVQTVVYKNQLYWFFGDTGFTTGGGNYRTTGATSQLLSQGGLDPNVGVNLNYFTSGGVPKPMFPSSQFPANALYWLTSPLVVTNPSGNETMLAYWSEQNGLTTLAHGIAVRDDANQNFDMLATVPLSTPDFPSGYVTTADFGGVTYFVFDNGIADLRVKADYADVTNPASYQTYTPLVAGTTFTETDAFGDTNITSTQINRDSHGNPIWAWQSNTDVLNNLEINALIGKGFLTSAQDPYQFLNISNPSQQPAFNSGSVTWNNYLNRWVSVAQQVFGNSIGGEIWIAESPSLTGPWTYAEKIQTNAGINNTETFYNIWQHTYYDQDSQYLYYEGTYTNFLVNGGLTGDYFNNNNLTGYAFEEFNSQIADTWGSGLPDSRLTSSNFSINWTGQITMPTDQSGNYVFKITTGGGVRLYVNNQLVINNWSGGASSYTGTFNASAGATYNIQLQYTNLPGSTGVTLSLAEPATPTTFVVVPPSDFQHSPPEPNDNYNQVLYRVDLTNPALAGLDPGTGLTGQYFAGTNFNTYVTTLANQGVNFSWGDTSPAPSVPAGNFSARFTGEIVPSYSQAYTFKVTSDGGVRLWVNGVELINDWTSHPTTIDTATMALNAGESDNIRIEYQDGDGSAAFLLQWQSASQPLQVVPVTALYPSPDGLLGTYYNTDALTNPVLQRIDGTVNFNWLNDSPDLASVNTNETYSMEWDGQVQPDFSGVYTFSTTADDGVRLWVNGQLLINDWLNQATTMQSGSITLAAGQRYDIELHYYNDLLPGNVQLAWSNASETGGVSQVIPTTNLFAGSKLVNVGFAALNGSNLSVYLSNIGPTTISGAAGGSIEVSQNGTQVAFGGATSITVTDTGTNDVLNFTGPPAIPFSFSNTSGSTVNVNGGSLVFAANAGGSVNLGALSIAAGASASIAPATTQSPTALTLSSLSLAAGAVLDVTNNELLIDFGAGANPTPAIAAWITSGYASGTWDGSGIVSSTAQIHTNYGLGYASYKDPGNPAGINAGYAEVLYTLLGDANLDGKVNGADFAIVAANFNQAVSAWDEGDFNYDGRDNGADFAVLAANFNQGSNIAVAVAAADATTATQQSNASAAAVSSANSVLTPSTSSNVKHAKKPGRHRG